MAAEPAAAPVRDAATVILYRNPERPEVLMGQRGRRAAFMPSKFVFPGGAVDPGDAKAPLASLPGARTISLLAERAHAGIANALLAAAIREVFEETGLILGTASGWRDAPPEWRAFADSGHRPSAEGLRFIFRAITPPGRSRRFDARFFLIDAAALAGSDDDFGRASDELSNLAWVPLEAVRKLDLPFITEVVLAEAVQLIANTCQPESVPFFRNDEQGSEMLRLGMTPP